MHAIGNSDSVQYISIYIDTYKYVCMYVHKYVHISPSIFSFNFVIYCISLYIHTSLSDVQLFWTTLRQHTYVQYMYVRY